MFTNKYPIFKKGNVIDKITLDLLRDNPLEILSLMYLDKKDGIINGFELVTDYERKKVTVTKGIAKCNNEIYWMKNDYEFDMPEYIEVKTCLKNRRKKILHKKRRIYTGTIEKYK